MLIFVVLSRLTSSVGRTSIPLRVIRQSAVGSVGWPLKSTPTGAGGCCATAVSSGTAKQRSTTSNYGNACCHRHHDHDRPKERATANDFDGETWRQDPVTAADRPKDRKTRWACGSSSTRSVLLDEVPTELYRRSPTGQDDRPPMHVDETGPGRL